MIRKDMPPVQMIEMLSFDDPLSEEKLCETLRKKNCIGMVAEHNEKIVGFMIYELHNTKLHILNFAVHPLLRRQGVGRQMADQLIGKLSTHRRKRILVEADETNRDTQEFWAAQGFIANGILPKFYDNGENAIEFEYRLKPTKEYVLAA